MKKLQIEDAEIMRLAVQDEILRSEESRYDHRLHGILLVCSGLSCTQVAEIFGHSRRTIQYWVKRFEQSGFAGLQEGQRPGRPSSLDEETWQALGKDLRCSPLELGYSQNLWDGKLLSHHLDKNYGVKIGVRQCQRLFHQLGFRRRKPRPVIAKADPEARARYKKTASPGQQKRS
ncbi:MAG: IS630 family transposase [Deltaproteobacteria bacterium]|nr:IS630 family transposase [Deltaproteobacteria bacterium]MBW1924298.1 IS630 family transposase [Deltaproteobacteria bacterium]MBW2102484.1 IS630 family transposase [Deltaproteobacteria bacterium]